MQLQFGYACATAKVAVVRLCVQARTPTCVLRAYCAFESSLKPNGSSLVTHFVHDTHAHTHFFTVKMTRS